jgi:hypothetical protein
MRGWRGTLILAAFPLATIAQTLIGVPLSPTYADCARMSEAHSARRKPLYESVMSCMNTGNIHTGYCAGACPGTRATAYKQCCSIESQICAEDTTYAQANELCMSRAHARAMEEEAQRTLDNKQRAQNNLLTKQILAVNDAYTALSTAYDAISNPTDFFLKAVSRQSPLYRDLFDSKEHLKNMGLAEELYRYAFNQARAGIGAQAGITSPVVSAVQSQSLEAIDRYYGRAFDQLNSSFEQMVKLDAGLRQTLKTFSPQTMNVKTPSPTEDSYSRAACSVLADSSASRRLLEEHSDQWLALTARCTK